MEAVITGVAGFIGSTLAERLIDLGFDVLGIDSFDTYYSPFIKRSNLAALSSFPRFTFIESDAAVADKLLFSRADYIFHLAGQPGIRDSWGEEFKRYAEKNILLTQQILEKVKSSNVLKRFVFASSSSVYGDSAELPFKEKASPHPVSPYGLTKLSAEHICSIYSRTYGIPCVCLRYFTVYGPRQRPDMAFHRFFRAAISGEEVIVYGNGSQSRDFTFVGDTVEATVKAALAEFKDPFAILNIGSGRTTRLDDAIDQIGRLTGKRLHIIRRLPQKGDMKDTCADIKSANTLLGYSPRVYLKDGLMEEYQWICRHNDLVLS